MSIKIKSSAMRSLETHAGGPLSLGQLIRAIREGEEMTLADFSSKLKISVSHLCDIEKGRKTVSPERAVRFSRILGRSKEQFVRLALQEIVDQAGLKMCVSVDAA